MFIELHTFSSDDSINCNIYSITTDIKYGAWCSSHKFQWIILGQRIILHCNIYSITTEIKYGARCRSKKFQWIILGQDNITYTGPKLWIFPQHTFNQTSTAKSNDKYDQINDKSYIVHNINNWSQTLTKETYYDLS